MRKRTHSARGFTLLELMFAIAIAAILFAAAGPSFETFIRQSRITSTINELVSAVHAARSEAVKRRSPTVLCLSTNPNDAAPDCDGDGSQGWIVFVDDADPAVASANDRNGEVDAGEAIIVRRADLPPTLRFRTTPAGNEGYVSFGPSGQARPIAVVGTPMTNVAICDSRGNVSIDGADTSAARVLVVSPSGSPRVTRSLAAIAGLGGCP